MLMIAAVIAESSGFVATSLINEAGGPGFGFADISDGLKWEAAQAIDLAGIINTVGAPLLRTLQGRVRCRRLREDFKFGLMRRDGG